MDWYAPGSTDQVPGENEREGESERVCVVGGKLRMGEDADKESWSRAARPDYFVQGRSRVGQVTEY